MAPRTICVLASGALLTVVAVALGVRSLRGADSASSTTPERRAAADVEAKLAALGYVEQVLADPDPQRRGVTYQDDRAHRGVNYFCNGRSVRFLDMDGNVLHEAPLEIATPPTSGCLAKPYRPGLMAIVRSPISRSPA